MKYLALVEAVEAEFNVLVESLDSIPPSTSLPTCPGWSAADLGRHVGQFCGFWTHVLCESTGRPKTPYPDEPEDDGVVSWLRPVGSNLVSELRATDSDTSVWTWYESDHSANFVARRSANELAVHRYGAQSARGACCPIAPELAMDGVDEMLTVLTTARPRSGEGTGQTLHLHATDVEDEWLVGLRSDRIEVSRQHAKADLALRGAISDLELTLYGRPALGDVEQFGDGSVLEAWRREFTF